MAPLFIALRQTLMLWWRALSPAEGGKGSTELAFAFVLAPSETILACRSVRCAAVNDQLALIGCVSHKAMVQSKPCIETILISSALGTCHAAAIR